VTAVASAEAPTRLSESRASRPAKVLLAFVALLAVYGLLSLFNDPRGTLGTDTGGKLATLAVMDQRGTFDPDIGYWAERYDPAGALHPLYYTAHIGDRWVNLTTLPMPVVARPLYALGGPRAVLLLPMLGAAFAALAARALARRVTGGDGWFAFWTVGLASPIAIYALDFWEHAPGVALVLWGMVFLWDLVDGRAGWKGALASGALFGAAATMRTDALVYAAAGTLTAGCVLLVRWRRTGTPRWSWMIRAAIAWCGGFAGLLVANQLLERAIVGTGIRSGRAASTATAAGGGVRSRMEEALTTAIGLNRFEPHTDWVMGALAVALVAYGAWRLTAPGRSERVLGLVAIAVAALLYVVRFADGLGFVPGVLSASPLAAAGLVIGWTVKRWRLAGVMALVAAPVVWVFQYSGGANPQWGGRYLLVTGTVLVVGGAIVLGATSGPARVVLVALAVVVTVAGVAWLSQRSHAVASAMRQMETGPDTVLVSREAHLLREGGAFYRPDQRWLTAESDRELAAAVAVARDVGARRLEVVGVAGRAEPRSFDGFERAGSRRIEFLPGLDVVLVTYTSTGG
jgi:hypothetical protein